VNIDILFGNLSAGLAILLAALGVLLAIVPPEKQEKTKKRVYGLSVLVIAVPLFIVNSLQASRNQREQKRIENTASDRQNNLIRQNDATNLRYDALSAQYDKLQKESEATFKLVSHPPQGMTPKQVADAFLSWKVQLVNVRDDRLNEILQDTIQEITNGLNQINQVHEINEADVNDGSESREEADRAEANSLTSVKPTVREAVIRACDLRDELLNGKRLTAVEKNQLDDSDNDGIFARLRSDDYIYRDLYLATVHLNALQRALQSHVIRH
jgi:23S rRNA pseudoU1915 N3-methylase RlmH